MATKARKRIDFSRVRIVVKTKENPRRKGTRAYKVFEAMKRVNKGKVTARDVMDKTEYGHADIHWDMDRKVIALKPVGKAA